MWQVMKLGLTKKYLLACHKNHFLDMLLNLKQTTSPISESKALFEELMLHCGIHEDY